MKIKLPREIHVRGGELNKIGGKKGFNRYFDKFISREVMKEAYSELNLAKKCPNCNLLLPQLLRGMRLKEKLKLEGLCLCTPERRNMVLEDLIMKIREVYGDGFANSHYQKLEEKWKKAKSL